VLIVQFMAIQSFPYNPIYQYHILYHLKCPAKLISFYFVIK